jgi:CBS domain-containing protein
MSVGRICIRDVYLARREESVCEAARRMEQQGVGMLLVLDDTRRPIGLVTDRDLAIRVVAAGRDPRRVTVDAVMTMHPHTVSESTPIETALSLMRSGAFRRLPVVDEEGRLAGVVTLDDVFALLTEEFASIRELLERTAPVDARASWPRA